MKTLEDLPAHIGPLSPNSRFEALRERQPGMWLDPDKCITCKGTGTFRRLSHRTRETTEYKCDCVAQWMLYCHLLDSGLDLSYQRACWDDVDKQVPDDIISAIVAYADDAPFNVDAGMGFILWGSNGTGKTLLAALLFKDLVAKGYDCYFVSFHDLLDAYTDGWRDKAARHRFNSYLSAEFLVIDDVGKENSNRTGVVDSMFDHLIRRRVAGDRATIITTNQTPAKMQAGYGGSVMSLLAEGCESIEVTGADFRHGGKPKDRLLALKAAEAVRPIVLG